MRTESLKVGDLVFIHHTREVRSWGVVVDIQVNDDFLLEYLIYRENAGLVWRDGISLWPAIWTFVGPVVIERCALGLRSGSPTE